MVMVLAALQLTLIFFALGMCLWQCYSHHSLRLQVTLLKNAQSDLDLSLLRLRENTTATSKPSLESLGQQTSTHRKRPSSAVTSGSLTLSSPNPASWQTDISGGGGGGGGVSDDEVFPAEPWQQQDRKSCSMSDLVGPAKRIQAKLSKSGSSLLGGGGGARPCVLSIGSSSSGGNGRGSGEESWLASSSLSRLEDFAVS